MKNLPARVRKRLLKSIAWTFPLSSYLWAVGVIAFGLVYVARPEWARPPDIILFHDTLWGLGLIVSGAGTVYAMLRERPVALRLLSFLIAVAGVFLSISSALEGEMTTTISAGLTTIYYSYVYLSADMINEYRAMGEDRLSRILEYIAKDKA